MTTFLGKYPDEELRFMYLQVFSSAPNKYQSQIKLAQMFGVSRKTIQYHLDKGVWECIKRDKKRYKKEHRKEITENNRDYLRSYRQITRHLDYYLPSAFNDTGQLSNKELSANLGKKTGLNLMPETIERIVKGFEDKHGLSPVMEKNGRYSLNNEYYAKVKVKQYLWRKSF